VASFGLAGCGVGVGDSAKVGDHPSQAWRIQAAGRLQQDRFGLDGDVGGEVLGARGQHAGMGGRQLPIGQGPGGLSQGAAEQGSGSTDPTAGGAGACVEAGPEPAGGGADLDAVFSAGGPARIDAGELFEPLAFQAIYQPPQDQHPLGPDSIGQLVQFLGGQVVDHRGEGCQRRHRPDRMCVRVHCGNLSSRHRKASTHTQSGDNRRSVLCSPYHQ
jgi:hypothetical protein